MEKDNIIRSQIVINSIEMLIALAGLVAFYMGQFNALTGMLYISPVYTKTLTSIAEKKNIYFVGKNPSLTGKNVDFLTLIVCFVFTGLDVTCVYCQPSILLFVVKLIAAIYPFRIGVDMFSEYVLLGGEKDA